MNKSNNAKPAVQSESQANSNKPRKFFVHIIESPNPKDLLDGRTEGKILTEALSLADIKSSYNLAVNRDTFLDAMYDRFAHLIKQTEGLPILHLSMHGNENGISLTDGDFIHWDALRDILLPINKAFSNHLVVCMSSCSGYTGCCMAIDEKNELPFFGIIGHSGSPNWSDTAVAFVSFYHRFFKGASVPEAVDAMKTASGDDGFMAITGHETRQSWIDFLESKRQETNARLINALLKKPGSEDK